MPHYSVKLATYDPTIIDAFDRLRKNRKQAAFTHEALKHFLSTEKGIQVLLLMERKTIDLSSANITLPPEKIDIREALSERTIGSKKLTATMASDSGSVLNSILE
jgi:hypothetical protein